MKSLKEGVVIEKKKLITFHEFLSIRDLNVPNKYMLQKKRKTFVYKGQYFSIDTFDIGGKTFSILIIQGQNPLESIELPNVIKKNLVKEVTGLIKRRPS